MEARPSYEGRRMIERLDAAVGHCDEVGCHNGARYRTDTNYSCVLHLGDLEDDELRNCTLTDVITDFFEEMGDALDEEFKCTYFIAFEATGSSFVDTRHCGAVPVEFGDGYVTCAMGHRVLLERR